MIPAVLTAFALAATGWAAPITRAPRVVAPLAPVTGMLGIGAAFSAPLALPLPAPGLAPAPSLAPLPAARLSPARGLAAASDAPRAAPGRRAAPVLAATETGVVRVSDMDAALARLRAASHPFDEATTALIERLGRRHSLPLRPERVFLIRDRAALALLDLPEEAGGAARLFTDGTRVEKVVVISGIAPLPYDAFIEFMIHEAVHLEDEGILRVPHDRELIHWVAEGWTQLRAHEMANESLVAEGRPAAPNKAYSLEVAFARAIRERHGAAPLDALVRTGSDARLREALGARWTLAERLVAGSNGRRAPREKLVRALQALVEASSVGPAEESQLLDYLGYLTAPLRSELPAVTPASVAIGEAADGASSNEARAIRAQRLVDAASVRAVESDAAASVAIDLDRELELSGLTRAQLGLISRHSRAGRPMAFDEFLTSVPLEENGYALGLSRPVYGAAAKATGLTPYNEAYMDIYGRVRVDATGPFMDKITADSSPILFMVPRRALDHPEGNMTQNELDWLLARPERMKDVYFVFGAYDWLPGNTLPDDLAARFAGMRGRLAVPSDATRLAQRRRLQEGPPTTTLEGAARMAAAEELLREAGRAVHGDARGEMRFFATAGGDWYAVETIARGLILRLPGGREAFISRGEPFYAGLRRRLDAVLY